MDWPDLLDRARIPFVTAGANVSRGYIAVACPFCGPADPSQHMALRLGTRFWRCWRNPAHKGGDPVKLLAALLRCSYATAAELVGEDAPPPDDLLGTVTALLRPPERERVAALAPPQWRPLDDQPSARWFVAYLQRRGFSPVIIWSLTARYGLRYCTAGQFAGRLIFPVEEDGQLRGWTGRSIYARERVRYLSHGPLHRYLLWQDQLGASEADTLVLCEGPFDALKIAVLGQGRIAATCCFTAAPSAGQISRLASLAGRFRHRVLLLDRDAAPAILRSLQQLDLLGFRAAWLPHNIKDPGELNSPAQLVAILTDAGPLAGKAKSW